MKNTVQQSSILEVCKRVETYRLSKIATLLKSSPNLVSAFSKEIAQKNKTLTSISEAAIKDKK